MREKDYALGALNMCSPILRRRLHMALLLDEDVLVVHFAQKAV